MGDGCKVLKIHHLGFHVGSALTTASFYSQALGLRQTYFKGLETNNRYQTTRVLQNKEKSLTLTFTAPITEENNEEFYKSLKTHGDHVADVALVVENVKHITQRAVKHGATIVNQDKQTGITIIKPPMGVWQHTLIPGDKEESFFDDFQKSDGSVQEGPHLYDGIDHVAFAVPSIGPFLKWYKDALNLDRFIVNEDDDEKKGLAIKGIRTIAVAPTELTPTFRFVFVEPNHQNYEKKSQISEFLEYHQGSGIAHAALHTPDICNAIEIAKTHGFNFISVPHTYYDIWKQDKSVLAKQISTSLWDTLQKHHILIDGYLDKKTFQYLLQTFTHPLSDRPTFYFEFISRKGAEGFGSANITHLFKAIEALQIERGNV